MKTIDIAHKVDGIVNNGFEISIVTDGMYGKIQIFSKDRDESGVIFEKVRDMYSVRVGMLNIGIDRKDIEKVLSPYFANRLLLEFFGD